MKEQKNIIKIAIAKAIQSFAEHKGYAKGVIVMSPSRDIKVISNYALEKSEHVIYVCGNNVVTMCILEVIEGLFIIQYDLSNSILPNDTVTSDDVFDFIDNALKSVGCSYSEMYQVRKFDEKDRKNSIERYNQDHWDSEYDEDLENHCLGLLTKKLIGTNIPLEYTDDTRDPFSIFYEENIEEEMQLLMNDEKRRGELEEYVKKMDSK